MAPTEKGEKGNPGSLELRPLAVDVIHAQPRVNGNPHGLPDAATAP